MISNITVLLYKVVIMLNGHEASQDIKVILVINHTVLCLLFTGFSCLSLVNNSLTNKSAERD